MQEKPPFGSYFDIFPNAWEGDIPLPYPPPAYFDFALRHAPDNISIDDKNIRLCCNIRFKG